MIEESVLYKDYKKYKVLPTIDKLLDYRLSLMAKRKDKTLPKGFINTEILATDFLLQKHNQ